MFSEETDICAKEIRSAPIIFCDADYFGSISKYCLYEDAELFQEITDDLKYLVNRGLSFIIIVGTSSHKLSALLNFIYSNGYQVPVIILSLKSSVLLTKELEVRDNFPEIQLCIDSKLLTISPLPCEVPKLKEEIRLFLEAYKVDGDHNALKIAREKVSRRLFDIQDKDQRHRMGNLMAASRILNGAFGSKDYNLLDKSVEERAKQIYKELIYGDESNQWTDEEKRERYEDSLKTIENTKAVLKTSKVSTEPWHRSINKILVIDDQRKMWEPVWKFILGDEKVDFAENGIDAFEKIMSSAINNQYYDCAFLDVKLGEDKENGIEVLQRIKHGQFDLPVIMMTACDNAELTKMCLRYGAESYFVKELRAVKDSVNYYTSIKSMINRTSRESEYERTIWNDFLKIEETINYADKKYKTAIGRYFKKAYYLLTLDEGHLLPAKLLVPEWLGTESSKYDGVAYSALIAAEQCLIAELMAKKKLSYNDALGLLTQKMPNWPYHPSFDEKTKRALGPGVHYYGLNQIATVRHPYETIGDKPITKNKAQKAMLGLLALCRRLSIDKPPKKKAEEFRLSKIDIRNLMTNGFTAVQSHEELSQSGAGSFWDGFKQKYGSNPVNNFGFSDIIQKVAFIDDEGEKSDWVEPLRTFFNFKGLALDIFESYHLLKKISNLDKYSLVLLDLVHGQDHAKGIDILDEIKKDDISVPVIMLTADNSSYYARRCLLHGADDYFVKQPYAEGNEIIFFKSFENKVNKYIDQIKKTKRKTWWKIITAIQDKGWGLSDEKIGLLKTAKQISKKTHNEIIKEEQMLISSSLREGYFYYLISINKEHLIDYYRVARLLTKMDRPGIDDIYICFGQLTEYLITNLAIVQGKEANNITHLIDGLEYPYYQQYLFDMLWKLRNESKTRDLDFATVDFIIDALNVVLFDFEFNFPSDRKIRLVEDNYHKQLRAILAGNKLVKGVVTYVPTKDFPQTTFITGLSPLICKGLLQTDKRYDVGKIYSFGVKKVVPDKKRPDRLVVLLNDSM